MNDCPKLFITLTAIITIPLYEIIDNIYKLLGHGPTCRSSLSCVQLAEELPLTSGFAGNCQLAKAPSQRWQPVKNM